MYLAYSFEYPIADPFGRTVTWTLPVKEFEFINGGAERAEVVWRKIQTLSDNQIRFASDKSNHVDIRALDSLSDGRATELLKKIEARWEIDHPFLSSFVGSLAPPFVGKGDLAPALFAPIAAVEAIPFVGAAGEQVDPESVQSSSLLDLAMDASFAEFCPSDGSVVLRFHAIVAARADPAR